MCDPEELKSPELAGLDENELMPPEWSHFNIKTQRNQSLRSFPAPSLSRLAFLIMMVFFALSFIFSVIILSRVVQKNNNDNNNNQNLEEIQKKLNQLSAQLKDERDLRTKEQLTASQLIEQLNKTLSSICRSCPDGWKLYKGSCYFFSVTRKPWEVAREACEVDGTNLAIINSPDEHTYLRQHADYGRQLWIGLSDKKKEGTWHWVDGTILEQSYWNEGEPNNIDDEDCCEMTTKGWNDAPCSKEDYWICEKEAFSCPKL
ncbi:CD209 antigen isoform X2 [Macrotis lagotis]|uniref:CD209 antigen isoform X2 n=1 Tax=Macrotis lagotis TaxID=92651 RepID=UPI003D68E168